jgi:hypothetical protein
MSHTVKTKTLIMIALVWELVQVLFLIASTPPVNQASRLLGFAPLSSLTFFTYQSLFYHDLAIPLVAILVYITLQVFEISGLLAEYATYSITLGYALASIGGIGQILTRWNPIARGAFFAGLGLGFTAGLALLVAFNPFRKAVSHESRSRRWNLTRQGLWLAVLFVLAAAVVGAYASMGSSQWGASGIMDKFTLIKSTHEHIVITVIDVAIVVLTAEHFGVKRFEGLRGFFAEIGMYSMFVGVPVVAISTFATVPFGVEAHNVITPFSAVLLQGALFVMYAVMADLALKPGSDSKLKKLFGDPVSFGLLFIFMWTDAAVGLPGIYVAVNLSKFRGSINEMPFLLGHEHALITLTAMALLLLGASIIGIKGFSRKLIGLTVTAGYVIGTGAAVLFIFLDPNPNGGFAMPYIQVGIVLMLIGVLTTIVAGIGVLKKGA